MDSIWSETPSYGSVLVEELAPFGLLAEKSLQLQQFVYLPCISNFSPAHPPPSPPLQLCPQLQISTLFTHNPLLLRCWSPLSSPSGISKVGAQGCGAKGQINFCACCCTHTNGLFL